MLGIKDLRQHITLYVNDILDLCALKESGLTTSDGPLKGIWNLFGETDSTSAKFWSRHSPS
jgi:hypothetical protein